MTTLEVDGPSVTTVELGGARGGPDQPTLRQDRWWVAPVVTVTVLTAFVGYATYAAFANKYYYVGAHAMVPGATYGRDLISPFYSPCLTQGCVSTGAASPIGVWSWWTISPALLILIFPLGFRLTCYYYRKAYYRSFWWAPPSCAVADAHTNYKGESRIPLILQNVHRYFFFFGLIFNVILTIDAVLAFRQPGLHPGWGVSIGTIVLCANAALLWLYSISCHACRHLCGGGTKMFSTSPIRYRMWKLVTPLNSRHMLFAWLSLCFVAFTDLYVRLVASGTIQDLKLF